MYVQLYKCVIKDFVTYICTMCITSLLWLLLLLLLYYIEHTNTIDVVD